MLFFVFLSGIPIKVMVFQVKKLNGHQAFKSDTLRTIYFSSETTHFIIVVISNKTSLLFREPSSSVVTFSHLNSLEFLKALPLMLLLS